MALVQQLLVALLQEPPIDMGVLAVGTLRLLDCLFGLCGYLIIR